MASVSFYNKLIVLMDLDKKNSISKDREMFYKFLISFQMGLFNRDDSNNLYYHTYKHGYSSLKWADIAAIAP